MPVDKSAWPAAAREITTFLPDVVVLFKDIARDPRVSRGAKIKVGAALAYLVSPIDLIADVIPGVGMLDDVAIVAYAARELLDGAGADIVREHWRGSQHGLDVVLRLVDTDLRPRRMLRSFVVDAISGKAPRARVRGRGRVIDGEVVDRKSASNGR
ncbi:MAG: YkvA family protein [Mycobacteriales bacterium]